MEMEEEEISINENAKILGDNDYHLIDDLVFLPKYKKKLFFLF